MSFIKIKNYKLWLLFFFSIFIFTLSMIIWTVYNAVNTPIYNEMNFFQKYQDVNKNFNNIVKNNTVFNQKFIIELDINSKKIDFDLKDIILSQRILRKKGRYKNLLDLEKNKINFVIKDRITNINIKNAKIKIIINRINNSLDNRLLDNFKIDNNIYSSDLNNLSIGYWTIHGSIKIDKYLGYFYIKTSTKNFIKDKKIDKK